MSTSLLSMTLLIVLVSSSYLEMPLVRTPAPGSSISFTPVTCHNGTVSNEADFKEICYEKDITYSIPFIIHDTHYSLSADFTTPLSWIKGKECKIEGTHKKCHRQTETIVQQFKQGTRSKSRLHKKVESKKIDNAIIEGSSERIRGEIEKDQTMVLTVKDSNRLNNLLQLIMLGLFIYGERDNLTLTKTNFVDAMFISPNLDVLSDGAISLRFDNTAQTSFLDEIFAYVNAIQRSVVVSLNNNDTITIGDLTAKDTDLGYSGIQWIDMPNEDDYGHLPEIINLNIDDVKEDRQETTTQSITGIFTLSASYLSFPEQVIQTAIISKIGHDAICKINSNSYLECSSTSKKKLQKLLSKNFVIGFKGANMIIPLNKLLLKLDHGKRAIFNIKKSVNLYAVLGEPIFQHYFMAFDYLYNRVGFSGKREVEDYFIFDITTLIRFLCCVMVFGCCVICCYEPISKLSRRAGRVKRQFRIQKRREKQARERGVRSRGYNPLSSNVRSNIFQSSTGNRDVMELNQEIEQP